MKKIYAIVVFASCLFITVNAQSQLQLGTATSVPLQSLTNADNTPQTLTTATLVPTSHSYTCAATQIIFILEKNPHPIDTGYAFGNNIWGETGSAQRYNDYTGTI